MRGLPHYQASAIELIDSTLKLLGAERRGLLNSRTASFRIDPDLRFRYEAGKVSRDPDPPPRERLVRSPDSPEKAYENFRARRATPERCIYYLRKLLRLVRKARNEKLEQRVCEEIAFCVSEMSPVVALPPIPAAQAAVLAKATAVFLLRHKHLKKLARSSIQTNLAAFFNPIGEDGDESIESCSFCEIKGKIVAAVLGLRVEYTLFGGRRELVDGAATYACAQHVPPLAIAAKLAIDDALKRARSR